MINLFPLPIRAKRGRNSPRIEGLGPHVIFALHVLAQIYRERGRTEVIITSAVRPEAEGSKHSTGDAVDVRGKWDSLEQEIAAEIRRRLPAGFDVVAGYDAGHIHIEWDPKKGEQFQ